jgi:type IV fimbrial biogenesis protein FimT
MTKPTVSEHGFTLVELLVTLAVAMILLTFGVPSTRDFIMNARLSTYANEFVTGIQLTRGTAIKQQRNARICVSTTWNSNPPTCTGGTDWSDGWVAWVDQNRDGVLDSAEVLRVMEPLNGNSLFTSTANTAFTYDSTGMVSAGDTLTLCDTRNDEQGRIINITPAGRVNLSQGGC